eukprot:5173030-Pleurochrysis_carterae.AAC.1
MAFWGEGKLDLVHLPKLLLALTENGRAQPLTSEKDKASWAKQMMLKTFKHRNYSGWKEILVAEQKAKRQKLEQKTNKGKGRRTIPSSTTAPLTTTTVLPPTAALTPTATMTALTITTTAMTAWETTNGTCTRKVCERRASCGVCANSAHTPRWQG